MKVRLIFACLLVWIFAHTSQAAVNTPAWPLKILGWNLDKAYPGLAYTTRIAVQGGTYPYKFRLAIAPAGLQIDPNKGEITWVAPTATGTHPVSVVVRDSVGNEITHNYSIAVDSAGFYFVAPNGVDDATADGSINRPWRTLAYANHYERNHAPTDVIYVRGGTYALSLEVGLRNRNMSPLVWLAFPGERVVLDAQGRVGIGLGTEPGQRVLFQGFEFRNAAEKMIWVQHYSRNLVFRNNLMHGITSVGRNNPAFIFFEDAGPEVRAIDGTPQYENVVVQDNVFHGLRNDSVHGGSVVLYNVSNMLYENNEAYDIDGRCVGDKDDGYFNTFRNNVWHDCSEGGIRLENQITQNQIEVSHNLIYNVGPGIVVSLQPGYLRDVYIHHNTIIGGSLSFGYAVSEPGSTNINIYNNIIAPGASGTPVYIAEERSASEAVVTDKVQIDNNLLWTTAPIVFSGRWNQTRLDLAQWQAAGKDIGGVFADPGFIGRSLPANSPYLGVYGRDLPAPVYRDSDRDKLGDDADPAPLNLFVPNDEGWNISKNADFSTTDDRTYGGNQKIHMLVWTAKVDHSRLLKDVWKIRSPSGELMGSLSFTNNGNYSYSTVLDLSKFKYRGPALIEFWFEDTNGVVYHPQGIAINLCAVAQAQPNGPCDDTTPSAPSGLRTTEVSASRVALAWNAASDNIAVAGYRIYRNGIAVGTSQALAFTDETVIPATTYSYQISAYDAAGLESPLTTPVTLTTPAPPLVSIAAHDFETGNAGLGEFAITRSHGRRCGNVGRNSDCAYSNVIMNNNSLPAYPEIPFPRQTGPIFVYFDVKVPDNFYIGLGSHGYYLYDSYNPSNGRIVIDPESQNRNLSDLEWDNYTTAVLRGSGYHRMARSFEGFKPRKRGEWHSYQLMVVPSNKDASVGLLKLWIDGELANFAKIDTIPAFDRFWISNYWHSIAYTGVDQFGNLFEDHSAPFHPPFEVLLDNIVISQGFVERGDNRHQIERVKFAALQPNGFEVHFDTTARASVKLEWGETPQYGNQVSGSALGHFHMLPVTGLAADRTYYLRLSAVNDAGTNATAEFTMRTAPSGGGLPQFDLPDWTGEIYQAQLGSDNVLTYSGAPVFVKNFRDLSLVNWAGDDSDTLIRTDRHMVARYRKRQHFTAGDYNFKVGSYDGVRVYVDGTVRVDRPNRGGGRNHRRDFELTLSEGVHEVIVEHYIYRMNDWEGGGSKFLQFAIEPLDRTPPRLITEGIYNTDLQNPTEPVYAARCDEDCAWVIDFGETAAYGQQLRPRADVEEPTSPTPWNRFPVLTAGATYHYRVTLSDNSGNTVVFPDRTFRVADTIPPRQIKNLTAERSGADSVVLRFSSPGADSSWGTAAAYDARVSNAPITLSNWEQATRITGLAAPLPANASEAITVRGVPAGSQYYFAVKALDGNGLAGLMSNVAGEPAAVQMIDQDGDGYGVASPLGPDCDDFNALVHAVSTTANGGTCVAKP